MTDYRKFVDNYPNTYWSTKAKRSGETMLSVVYVFFYVFGCVSFLAVAYLIRISL